MYLLLYPFRLPLIVISFALSFPLSAIVRFAPHVSLPTTQPSPPRSIFPCMCTYKLVHETYLLSIVAVNTIAQTASHQPAVCTPCANFGRASARTQPEDHSTGHVTDDDGKGEGVERTLRVLVKARLARVTAIS